MPSARLRVDPQLWFLLRRARRRPEFEVGVSASDTVGHVVQMVGVPLTEVGSLLLDGRPATAATRLDDGDHGPERAGRTSTPAHETGHRDQETSTIEVGPRPRPQPTHSRPPRFLLDVHLGSLARRLRLLGVDAAYQTDADDDQLVEQAVREQRVLLSRDRGLLGRTALPEGALVRGSSTPEQLEEVLRRFVPLLAPWSRCVRCNGVLEPVPAEQVAGDLEPGTRRSYRDFSRCVGCGRVYWRGAHSRNLEPVVREAQGVLAAAKSE